MAPRALREDAAVPVGKAAAAAVAWRFRGELRVTVIVKATFSVAPDVAMTRVEPEATAANELAPYLKRADVLFTGGAAAAGAQVGIAIAGGAQPLLDKTALVGAAGGAPFGPIPRAAPLPDLGAKVTEIPGTFDWDLLQASPPDQRTDYLRGDEWIVIEGLVPGHAELRARLPGARAQARIYGLSRWRIAEGKALAMNADALHVRGDDRRCTMTWRGSFALPDEAALDTVRIVVGVELPGEPIAWPDRADVLRQPSPAAVQKADATLPLPDSAAVPISSARDATVPLDVAGPLRSPLDALMAAAAARKPAASPAVAPSAPRASPRGPADATLPVDAAVAGAPLLPFIAAPPGAPPAIAPAEPRPRRAARSSADATLPVPEATARPPTLPFEGAVPPEPPPPGPPASRPDPPPRPAEPGPVAKAPTREILATTPSTEERKAPPAKRPAEQKLPPKVDVANKLYGSPKKR